MWDSRQARPSEQCPNCGLWYEAGDCNHRSTTRHGTLYGVCSQCAKNHKKWGGIVDRAYQQLAPEPPK